MEPVEQREISAPRVGRFKVYIQGDLKHRNFVILTVHDLGCNHSMWINFLQNPCMEAITQRAAFIHVDIPGQEDEAADLPADYTFPSMQSLGEDLVCILDQLDVKEVIGLGEGAGANVITRFAMAQPERVSGLCIIHCTGSTATVMESLKDQVINWKLEQIGMNPTAEAYLVLHRFGAIDKAENKEQLAKVIEAFQDSLRSKINPRNLKRFVQSFMKRTNIAESVGKIRCPVLMITGTLAYLYKPFMSLHKKMQATLPKKNVEILEVLDVANVLEEKPEKFAESFLYFLQGQGFGCGVPMPRVQRSASIEGGVLPVGRMRSQSMEEADQPRGIYSMSPPKYGGSSPPKMETMPPISSSPPKS
ncbi:uncharacterized protein ZK1073.1 isoform X2 [Patella vulgata]|uniref:uncharacterized protein ZK1073.1 isoform X2 n=1 Tax=Patella vulgata TaxID=6465 RepID=UPI00217FE3D8|nr:uncharacterized protein ZK1073.1 isoform X2 [Patella vulgata]